MLLFSCMDKSGKVIASSRTNAEEQAAGLRNHVSTPSGFIPGDEDMMTAIEPDDFNEDVKNIFLDGHKVEVSVICLF